MVDESIRILRTVHAIDHMVMLGVCTRLGSWKSSPHIGTNLLDADSPAEADRRVREGEPLATLLANRDIEIVRVTQEKTPAGLNLVSVDYRNLRLDPNRVQRVTSRG